MKVLLQNASITEVHAHGNLDDQLLGDKGSLRYNGRLYTYGGMHKGSALFVEASEPWEVTSLLTHGPERS